MFITLFRANNPEYPWRVNVAHIMWYTPDPDDAENGSLVRLSYSLGVMAVYPDKVMESVDEIDALIEAS